MVWCGWVYNCNIELYFIEKFHSCSYSRNLFGSGWVGVIWNWRGILKQTSHTHQARIQDFWKGGGVQARIQDFSPPPLLDIVCVTSSAIRKIEKHPHSWTFTKGGVQLWGPMLKSLHCGPKGGGGVRTPWTPPGSATAHPAPVLCNQLQRNRGYNILGVYLNCYKG